MTIEDVLRTMQDALERAGIPWMVTGSIVSSTHGQPRATQDIDIVIAPSREQLINFIRQFPSDRYYALEEDALDAFDHRRMFNIIDFASGWKVDFIFRKSRPFSEEELARNGSPSSVSRSSGALRWLARPDDVRFRIMKRALVVTACLLLACSAFAQGAIRLPEASPAASVGQTIGVTDISITYHRPAVNKRKIWGGLVPFDTPWRAGANENTTISFSTPVKIEGQPLPAGTYALYAIPTPSQWTLIFSKFSGDWGAYNYDPAEDALRVTVTPQTVSDSQERLSYTVDDVTNNSATASLRWEKLRVPMKIDVDLPATVRASIVSTLRGGKHWDASAWTAAARWELRNGDPDTALAYVNHSLSLSTTAGGLRTKAAILEKKGDAKTAAELRASAQSMFTEAETISIGYGVPLGAKKPDDAIAFLNNYAAAHPSSPELWRVYAGLGEAYSAKGDSAKAKESFDKAMSAAHDTAERTEVWDSINSAAAEMP